jgi:predicted Zn-dependent peptidase
VSFHHATLENGLQVVAELNDQAHSVGVGFFVKAGSRDETVAEWGLSHFLEHMVFKGTANRDAIEVNRDLDRIGAKHNAQTSEEDTIFHVTVLPEFLPRGLEILADILRPSLRDDDFTTEKQVILEEIQMYEDNPMSVAYEKAKALHYAAHPLARSILGTLESIGAMEVDQMRRYFAAHYGPPNVVLSVAGRTHWDEVLDLSQRHCGGWTGPKAQRLLAEPRGTHAFEAKLRAEDQQMVLVAVSDAPPLESDDRDAASLLATILGDHTGSRLYWELIDPGYADGAEVSFQDYNHAGAFFTFVSCMPEESQANLERVADLYRAVTSTGVAPEELERARNKVMARHVLRNERPGARMMSLGLNWTYRRKYVTIQDDLDAYTRVTVADVRRVLERWPLWPATLVTVGPTTDLAAPL